MNKYFTLLFLFVCSISLKGQLAHSTNGEKSPKLIKTESTFIEGMKCFIAEDYKNATAIFQKLIDNKEAEAGVYYFASLANLKNGNLNDAVRNAAVASSKDNKNTYYLNNYANLLFEQKNYKLSLESFENLIKINPENKQAYLKLVEIYMAENKYTAALNTLDKLEKRIGYTEEITHLKQNIYLTQNKLDQVLKEGEKLIKAEPLESQYVLSQAQTLKNANKKDKAQELLEKYFLTHSGFEEGLILLAQIYNEQGNKNLSTKTLKNAFETPEISKETMIKIMADFMSIIESDSDEILINQALEMNKAIIERDPEEARAYVFLGKLHLKKKEYVASRESFVKAADYDKSIFEVWTSIIDLDHIIDDQESLLKHTTQATEYFPNQPQFWYQNGLAWMAKNNFDEALVSLEEAENLIFDNKDLLQNTKVALGKCHSELKNYNASDRAYEEVIKMNPNNLSALNGYSYSLAIRKTKLELANKLSMQLIKSEPENLQYMATRAWVLFQLADYQEALHLFEPFILKNTDANANMYEHYGDILFKNDKKTLAIEQWKKARNLGGNNKSLEQKISKEQFLE